jgi:uncharacterized protein YceH (UPF0502 family)
VDKIELSVMTELLLRGAQTEGELRGRASRMHPFEDIGQVQSTLQKLMQREPVLVKVLPRQPGTKEARYAHLLSGDVAVPESHAPEPAIAESKAGGGDRLARLESEVAALRQELGDVKTQLAAFRKQFE